MVTETDAFLRSIRRWVLVCVILLGATGMTVADTMALTTGTEIWPGHIAFYGGFIAMVAATLMLLLNVSRTLASD